MYVIVIIGCGNIGKRYFESFANIHTEQLKIFLIDPNENNIQNAIDLFNKKGNNTHEIIQTSMDKLKLNTTTVDLAIIATCSNIRKQIIEQIIQTITVKYMILEKVLFTDLTHFDQINNLLESKQIKAWVNCPRRLWHVNEHIKSKYCHSDYTNSIYVYGTNWSLCSNTIHFMDLFAFFNDYNNLSIEMDYNKSITIHNSKNREQFKELSGMIHSKDSSFIASCTIDKQLPYSLNVIMLTKYHVLSISDSGSKSVLTSVGDDGIKILDFDNQYLSQQIHIEVMSILKTGKSNLPTYNLSSDCHKPFIKTIDEVFKNNGIMNCPIT
jgi:hypothetical protein